MMLSVPPPRSASRAQLLPGLSLRVGDMLDGLFRIEALVDAERSCLHLAGSQVGDSKPVIIQILVTQGPAMDQAGARFMAGVRKANALKGPHVARVLDIGVTPEGHPYVVREWPPMRSLESLLQEHPALGTEEAVAIALHVCDALAESHRHGLFHGDLNLRSVHLGWSAHGPVDVKLIDLGIGPALALLPLEASTISSPHLRAPEQLRPGAKLDARVDVFGVGVLLYTMLAGAPPFAADTPSALCVSVENDEPACLAGVPDALAEIVEACLAKDPAQRPESISALAEAIAAYAQSGHETLSRIRAYAAPLGRTLETPVPPSPLLEEDDEDMPDSSPTLVARGEYQQFARESLTDADITAKRQVVPAIPRSPDSSLQIPITVEPSVRDLSQRVLDAKAEAPPIAAKLPDTKAPAKREGSSAASAALLGLPKPAASLVGLPESSKTPAPPAAKAKQAEPAKAAPADAKAAPAPAPEKKADPAKNDETPAPAVVAFRSVPPMVIERDEPTVIVPRRRRQLQLTAAAVGVACLALGVFIGSQSSKLAHRDGTGVASQPAKAEALPHAPAQPAPLAEPAQPALVSTPANALPPAAVPASALPAAPVAAPAPATDAKAAPKKGKAAASAAPEKPAAAAPAAPAAEKPASAPSHPEPKANDDDLRRFLDDRR